MMGSMWIQFERYTSRGGQAIWVQADRIDAVTAVCDGCELRLSCGDIVVVVGSLDVVMARIGDAIRYRNGTSA